MEDDTLAFFRAIVSGKEDEVTRLLDADPAWLEAARHHLEDDEDHLMPLMVADALKQLGMVRLLVDKGANIHAESSLIEKTALHFAAEAGAEEIVSYLLEHGADPAKGDVFGDTPVTWAGGRVHILQMLVEHMGVQGLQHRNDDGLTLLHIAAGADEESKVEFLLTHGLKPHVKSPDGATPLMYCALRNSPGVMRMLLQYMRGQGLDETDQSGRTALHYAMAQNTPDNVLALRTLLLAGANPTSVDEKGRTPRIKAEKNGFVACVSIFDWWDGELERGYLLSRARALHGAYITQQEAPASPMPSYLEDRAAAGLSLPAVDLVAVQKGGGGRERGGSRGRKAHTDEGAEEAHAVHAVLGLVVSDLSQELFTELVQGFHGPPSGAGAGEEEASAEGSELSEMEDDQ